MGNPASLVAGPRLMPMGIAATVSRAPSDADDTLDLHWLSPRDGQDGEEKVGERDLRWVSTSRLPAVDDDALLFVDSLGDPWAFVWATGALVTVVPPDPTAGFVRGQIAATGTGVSFADAVVTDSLGTTAKRGGGWEHVGGTFTADATFVRIASTATNTTTLRAITRLGGNIPVGQTVLIDYWLWS